MPTILFTGVATLDIINHLSSYPVEDTEVRADAQHIQTGGNACNSAIVMQQLGLDTYLLASRSDDANAELIFSALSKRHIQTTLCPLQTNSSTPTSYITLNTSNGSRSIVHYRNLNELQASDFTQLNLQRFDWLHFEARACDQLLLMLKHARRFNKPVSIELEKARNGIDEIMPYADILLISKPFALSRGFEQASDCLQYFIQKFPQAIISCTWGDQGAWLAYQQKITHQPAFVCQPLRETLGAGDTFNAGFIAAILKQKTPPQALAFACQLATNKCQQLGFDDLILPE